MKPEWSLIALTAALAIAVIAGAIGRGLRKKSVDRQRIMNEIMSCCKETDDFGKMISAVFSVVSSYIKAEEYAFYLLDAKTSHFALKSVHYRNTADSGALNLSYSGLIPHKKARYAFPGNVSPQEAGTEVGVRKTEKARILYIPIRGGNGLLQLKMGERVKAGKRVHKMAEFFSVHLEPVAAMVLALEKLGNRIKVLETAKQATRSVANIISGNGIFKMAINMFTKTINAKGGFFFRKTGNTLDLEVETGMSGENSLMFKYDSELHVFLSQQLGEKKMISLSKKDEAFDRIPVYLSSEGVRQMILFNVEYEENHGIAGFWYSQRYEIDDYQTTTLLLMFSKITDVFQRSGQIATHSQDNLDTLKLISTLVDDLSPYTVGFSNMMEYYAQGVAREMGLSETEIESISLAAFLSNIGISMLSYDIFLSKRRYMEYDYEVIKLHAEVGADIIEAMYGDIEIANMVRYHHERIDGLGYPHRLKGDEIPVGARILAVVQFFIAKISPRSFRDASTYDEALKALSGAAGTQLDAEITRQFIAWIEGSREEKKGCDCSLDFCWNMQCVSHEICSKCPARFRQDKRCWEVEGVACMAHGNQCETCFVYTEYHERKKRSGQAALTGQNA